MNPEKDDGASRTPTTKIAAVGIAAVPAIALASTLQWFLAQFGVEMPEQVAMAVVAAVMWAAGYIKREPKREPRGKHAGD